MKILLCPNEKRDRGYEVTKKVAGILAEAGADTSVCPFEKMDGAAIQGFDAVITFGGDGTILHAARAASEYGVPLLGVNLGNKGFIAELEVGDIDLVKKLAAGDFSVEKRMMIDFTLRRGGREIYKNFALNDVFLGGIARVVRLTVFGDGRKISSFYGDGIIVATPTGSTAYSLSAGGPLVEPDAENIIVTPICPHDLWAKAYVLTATRVVTVLLGELGEKRAYLSSDGGEFFNLESGDELTVTRSERYAKLIRLTDRSFYERVSEKLGEKL